MNTVLHWLVFGIPWYVQTGIILVLVAIPLAFVANGLGFESIKKYIVPILGVVAALSLLSRAQQKGYQRKEAEDQKAAEDAIKRAEDARREQEQKDADPDRLRDDDGFRRD